MPYTWVNEPPIVEVANRRQFEALRAEIMIKIYAAGVLSPATPEAVKWNESIDNSMRSLNRIRDPLPDWRGFVYSVAGRPVALMAVSEMVSDCGRKQIRIDCLATDPQSEGGDDILIEHAVNLSEAAGYEGHVAIGIFDSPEAARYEALGFGLAPGNLIRKLDPGVAREWVKVDGEWRIKRYRIRGPLDNWREYTVVAQITGRLRTRNFGFLR